MHLVIMNTLMRLLVFCLLLACVPSPARAWLDNGHMAIARFAWQKLSEDERRQATAILREHPHYAEFLQSERPNDVPEDQWAFMRAAVWPDFVRDVHADQYNKPSWHYIEMAYVPAYSKVSPPAPRENGTNVVTQIDWAAEKLHGEDRSLRPIALCWLLHLVGDIHQPDHAITLFSEQFPNGDKGGNLALIRIENGESIKLHFYWDGLLGQYASWPEIVRLNEEFAQLEKTSGEEIDRQLAEHTTPASWALESHAAGKKYAYLDGDLRPANYDIHPREDNVPQLSAEYARQANKTAQLRAVLAARRAAATLAKSLPASN